MKRKIGIALIIFIVTCAGFLLAVSVSPIKELENSSIKSSDKPIMLMVVDSLMSEPLQKKKKNRHRKL